MAAPTSTSHTTSENTSENTSESTVQNAVQHPRNAQNSAVSTQRFPGRAEQVSAARRWALTCVPVECPRRDDLALVLSELVTNAVLHSASSLPGGQVEVRIEVEAGAVAVTVTDQGAALTAPPREPGEYGRGLAIVTGLADAYDVTATATGRCTWCRLDWWQVPAQTHPGY